MMTRKRIGEQPQEIRQFAKCFKNKDTVEVKKEFEKKTSGRFRNWKQGKFIGSN